MDMEQIARYAFIAFVFIAIIMGLVVGYLDYVNDPNLTNTDAYVMLTLLVLGVIVGLISITVKEIMPFLIAAIALIVASSANIWFPLHTIHELLYEWAHYILNYIVAFAAPAAVINAIKSVFAMTKEK